MITVLEGDCRSVLGELAPASVQCCVTSPPYFGLRDYGAAGQVGLERSPDDYVRELVAIFAGVWRVLRNDGTLWLNLGDSYAAGGPASALPSGNLLGIPWRVAFGLQAAGWLLRSAIVWHKPNPIPESVRNRPTCAHESVFLFAKRRRYFYDAAAIREPSESSPADRRKMAAGLNRIGGDKASNADDRRFAASARTLVGRKRAVCSDPDWRNARNVWRISSGRGFKGAHSATMPLALAARCVAAGSRPGDLVLDPFGGAGTTGLAAVQAGRRAVLVELNPDYAALARARVGAAVPELAAAA